MLDRRLKAVIFDLFGTLVYPFSRARMEQVRSPRWLPSFR